MKKKKKQVLVDEEDDDGSSHREQTLGEQKPWKDNPSEYGMNIEHRSHVDLSESPNFLVAVKA